MADQCNIEIANTKAAGWCWRCHTHDVNGFNLPGRADAEVAATAHTRARQGAGRG